MEEKVELTVERITKDEDLTETYVEVGELLLIAKWGQPTILEGPEGVK